MLSPLSHSGPRLASFEARPSFSVAHNTSKHLLGRASPSTTTTTTTTTSDSYETVEWTPMDRGYPSSSFWFSSSHARQSGWRTCTFKPKKTFTSRYCRRRRRRRDSQEARLFNRTTVLSRKGQAVLLSVYLCIHLSLCVTSNEDTSCVTQRTNELHRHRETQLTFARREVCVTRTRTVKRQTSTTER